MRNHRQDPKRVSPVQWAANWPGSRTETAARSHKSFHWNTVPGMFTLVSGVFVQQERGWATALSNGRPAEP